MLTRFRWYTGHDINVVEGYMSSRRYRPIIYIAIWLVLFMLPAVAHAETELVILLDASSSMSSPGTPGTSGSKFSEVRAAINNFLNTLPVDIAVGVRLMGGSPSVDCYSSYLLYTPGTGLRSNIQDSLSVTNPSGTRGLYQGLEDCLTDFTSGVSAGNRSLLVITDGGDACDRDLELLARTYTATSSSPYVTVIGLDLSTIDEDAISAFTAVAGGRLVSLDSVEDLAGHLTIYSESFSNNLRIHLQDTEGNAVYGDIIVRNTASGQIVNEILDVAEYSINLPAGTYEITGRYLGEEVRSQTFSLSEGYSNTVTLEFNLYVEPFILMLRDLYNQPLRARVSFINTAGDPVLTTEVESTHRVSLPPGVYTAQVRMGEYTYEITGIEVGFSDDSSLEVELPVELGTLEVEVSNYWGTPLNAEVMIYDADGTVMDEAPFTSYLYSRLPPGTYTIYATFGEYEVQSTVFLSSGDQLQVPMEIPVELGDIFIILRTESGNDAWGWVHLYDMNGNLVERYDRERFEAPDWYFTDIPVGLYRIEAEVDNIIRIVSSVEVRANEETEVEVVFPDEVY